MPARSFHRRFVGPHTAAAFVLILLYCLPAIQALQISNPASLPVTHDEGQFLILTDIHFDPFSGNDPHTIQALASSPVEKWQAILQPSASREPSRDGADSNYALLISALQAARQSAHYDYLLVPGDSLAHHFAEKYDEFHPGEGYQEFAIKTLVFVNRMIQQTFPGVPILRAGKQRFDRPGLRRSGETTAGCPFQGMESCWWKCQPRFSFWRLLRCTASHSVKPGVDRPEYFSLVSALHSFHFLNRPECWRGRDDVACIET